MGLAVLAGCTALQSHPPVAVGFVLVLLWPLLAFIQLSNRQTSCPIQSFQHTPQGWRLQLDTGAVHFAEVNGPVRLTPAFVVLCWQEMMTLAVDVDPSTRRPGQRWRVVIWADQLSAEDWRRFSVSLRWRRREGSSGDKILSASSVLSSG